MPSILRNGDDFFDVKSFKVLNLVINGMPSILRKALRCRGCAKCVLNLVINGMPSILKYINNIMEVIQMEVLNLVINGMPSILTVIVCIKGLKDMVLNLVINGMPSIQKEMKKAQYITYAKVLNLVINGMPSIHRKHKRTC